VTGQRTNRAERLFAQSGPRRDGSRGSCAPFEAGHKGTDTRGGGGIVDPSTIAARADAIRSRMHGDVRIEHRGALELTEEWAPRIGPAGRVYLDPPYQGATGYPATCPREEVLVIAETWARHGARVVLSEACGLAAELGAGWEQIEIEGTKKPEWLTIYTGDRAPMVTGARWDGVALP
jgi:hypothetical protein